jgi:hypothetical protein
MTTYSDIDVARVAAKRLAEERGWAMYQANVELARRQRLGSAGALLGLFC